MWFERIADEPLEWTNLEIRRFYRSELQWDEAFAKFVNTFDCFIVGGGNYFEMWVPNSPTGTSIAWADELLEKIHVPIFFNSLGVDTGQGVYAGNEKLLESFLERLMNRPNTLLSVRNDGAKKNLEQQISAALARSVIMLPDGGFFANYKPWNPGLWSSHNRVIAINVAEDMAALRYGGFPNGIDDFAAEFAGMLADLAAAYADIKYIFIPHIPTDLNINYEIIAKLPDGVRRERVMQAIYGAGDSVAEMNFGIYLAADLCLSMRFHANVVPLGACKHVIGLDCYPQIADLYEEIGFDWGAIDVRGPGFSIALKRRIEQGLEHREMATLSNHAPHELVIKQRTMREAVVGDWIAGL